MPDDNLRKKYYKDTERIAQAKRDYKKFYGIDFNLKYNGFNLDEFEALSECFKCNIFVYCYDRNDKIYYLSSENTYTNPKYTLTFNVLYITNETNTEAHYLFVSNPETLTGSKICPHCHSQWFARDKDNRHSARAFKNHLKNVSEKINQKRLNSINHHSHLYLIWTINAYLILSSKTYLMNILKTILYMTSRLVVLK
jgi:hypothetical protein